MENREILSLLQVQKRDGRLVEYDQGKISSALSSAFDSTETPYTEEILLSLTDSVEHRLMESKLELPQVEEIQDFCEEILQSFGYYKTSKAYILYRDQRNKMRTMNSHLMKLMETITFQDAENEDLKRENANVDGNTAMGTMLKYGSESSKYFVDNYILPKEIAQAHTSGDIHIHDKDFYMLTETCCQIDLLKLFQGGFSTGHGFLREPNDIRSYSSLGCIAIQANQNEMHGGQSVPNFDYSMAPGVAKTFRKLYYKAFNDYLQIRFNLDFDTAAPIIQLVKDVVNAEVALGNKETLGTTLSLWLISNPIMADHESITVKDSLKANAFAYETALKETEKATYQAMEALIHNLNTMNSRAGAQVPFSSINYGTDTSLEGRMVVKNLLLATDAGLGNGETPIFPVQIFKVKEGINFNAEDPNYDLFKLALKTSAKRLFPNFSFIDAPFNLKYYKEGDYNTEVAYMGCRTRVMGNHYDKNREVTSGRGNLSFTSVNLPRIALEADGDLEKFYAILDVRIKLVVEQLLHRFKIQSNKKGRNYPFLMGQGVWLDSEKLGRDDSLDEVLKHGTLSMGFIGLAETLKALTGKHHGESPDSQRLGLAILGHMRRRMDEESIKTGLNFTLLATPAEGLSGRFVAIDQKRFGSIPGVTDREYYTNSFHIPVYYPIKAYKKISLEAPYHELTNAGHISYVELDGDTTANPDAFEKIIRYMKEVGMGYGSINHPVDRDPVCGYNGIIGSDCPQCHRTEDDGEPNFERIRRITGYLVGTTDRWNNAKRAEERNRLKHGIAITD